MQREYSHLDLRELVYLETDGELSRGELQSLERHVAECGECRRTRHALTGLDALLADSKSEVHPEFTGRVIAALPPAGWELRRPASWRGAAAAFLALAVGAYAFSWQGQPLGEALPWLATLGSLAELFRSAALAGAGLLSASWSGMGSALGELLARSPAGFVAFGLFVLGVDVLFVRFLWRLSRRQAPSTYAPPSDRPDARDS